MLTRYFNPFFITSFMLLFVLAPPVSAISPTSWRAGNIIDDPTFTDKGSMSVNDIQAFLNSKVRACDTWGTGTSPFWAPDYNGDGRVSRAEYGQYRGNPVPFTCLKDYREVPKTSPGGGIPANNYGAVNGTNPAGSQSAAQIIWQAAQDFNISPKTLLVTLQKESGLITDDWTFRSQLVYAMGAHCPDTGPGGSANCDANYSGFSLQIRESADLMRYYLDNMQQSWWSNKRPYQNNYIQYDVETSCGGTNVFMDNKATTALYVYTPYQPSQAALNAGYGSAEPCGAYGNRNFWLYFHDWFGTTQSPGIFKVDGSSSVYVNAGGYKIAIPSMYTLQDYGYDPGNIATISQASSESIPTPPDSSGISKSLGHVIKSTSDSDADGGAAYFVSVGHRYPITSMDQFNRFGFQVSNITYLPLSYIQTLRAGPDLYNYLLLPDGSIFGAEAGTKKAVMSAEKHSALNPSKNVTRISQGAASLITSGNPYSENQAVFVKKSNEQSVYIYHNDTYSSLSADVYSCWGGNVLGDRPLRILNPDYLPASIPSSGPVGCLYNDSQGSTYALSKTKRYAVPTEYGLGGIQTVPSHLSTLLNSTPIHSTPVLRAVKSTESSTVWYLEGGLKHPIPSMSNLYLLTKNALDIIEEGALKQISSATTLKFGDGQTVKSDSGSAVYVLNGTERYAIANPDQFNALKLSWSNLETYTEAQLNARHTVSASTIKPYLFVSQSSKMYFMDRNNCYLLNNGLLASYGQDQDNLKNTQSYSSSVAPYVNFDMCKVGTEYIKSDSNGTVYKLEAGNKRAVSSWNKLIELNGGKSPSLTILSQSHINDFPDGSSY